MLSQTVEVDETGDQTDINRLELQGRTVSGTVDASAEGITMSPSSCLVSTVSYLGHSAKEYAWCRQLGRGRHSASWPRDDTSLT